MPMPRKPDPVKFCETCGARLVRRVSPSGRLEVAAQFAERRFCSLSCANTRTEVGDSQHHKEARRIKRPRRCERCGSRRRLHVHHRDEDTSNNDPTNLEVLCGSCHLREHWSRDTYRDRQAVRYQPCGTRAAYRRGCHCSQCVEANRAYFRALYRAKRATTLPTPRSSSAV
jgi:hypothetical protein